MSETNESKNKGEPDEAVAADAAEAAEALEAPAAEPSATGEPESAAAPESVAAPAEPTREGGTRWPVLVLALLALLTAGGGIGGGYLLWKQLGVADRALGQRVVDLETRLETALKERDAAQARVEREVRRGVADVDARVGELTHGVASLRTQVGRQHTGWVVGEAEYLMRLANNRLRLAGDLDTAKIALELADTRLKDLGDPAFLEVRGQIKSEIAALEAAPRPDIAGMALTLTSLAARVPTLPLATAQRRDLEGAAPAAEVEGDDWRAELARVWQDLKGLVVVRRNDRPVAAMLAPKESLFLRENLRLKLESARLALLLGDEALFRNSLATSRLWLEAYFDRDDPAVAGMASQIDTLAGVEIAPVPPDISGSLRVLREVVVRIGPDKEEPAAEASAFTEAP